jgi:hypothetical protein
MNTSLKKIPIVPFGEVKFEVAVLRSKIGLELTRQQHETRRATITRRDDFAQEWKIQRAGSEGASSFGLLVQSFQPRPRRLPKNSATRAVCEPEMESRK